MQEPPFTTLEQLLQRLEAAGANDRVSLDAIVKEVGQSSFGPLVLLAGLITVSPVIGDTPGVPTAMSIFVFATVGQLLFGRKRVWLPQWLLQRSIAKDKFCRALNWMRRPVRLVDRFLRPRLTILTGRFGTYGIAAGCILIAAALPFTELILLTANGLGAALTAFGLALIANDGLMALLAFALLALTVGLALLAVF